MEQKKVPTTIDDWKHYAKELKLRIRKLEKKQADLVLKLSEQPHSVTSNQSREKLISFSVTITRSTIKIQKVWRGFRQRKKFKNELRRLANQKSTSATKASRVSSNEFVIKEIHQSVKKLGFNMEMLYRACDKNSQGLVYLDDFKQFLKRLNLKLSLSQLNRFLLMLDEECTGLIRREEYMDALSAYGVSSERDNEKDHARTYEQECMLRLAASLRQQGITPEEVCNFCDNSNSATMRTTQFAKFAHNMSDGFQEKEIHGLITYFDLDKTSHIEKDFFIQEINKADRLIQREPSIALRPRSSAGFDPRMSFSGSGRNFRNTGMSSGQEDRNSPATQAGVDSPARKPPTYTSMTKDKKPLKEKEAKPAPIKVDAPKFTQTTPASNNTRSGRFEETDDSNSAFKDLKAKKVLSMRDESPSMVELSDIKRVIVKMDLNGQPIYEFLQALLLKMKDVKKDISITEISALLDQQYPKGITKQEKSLVLKNIDTNINGSVDVIEAKNFCLRMAKSSKERVLSLKLIEILTARMLEHEGTSTKKFLLSKDINPQQVCPLDEFIEKIGPTFEILEGDGAEIFADLDYQGTGNCDLKGFITRVDAYRGDLSKYTNETVSKAPIKSSGQSKPQIVVEPANDYGDEEQGDNNAEPDGYNEDFEEEPEEPKQKKQSYTIQPPKKDNQVGIQQRFEENKKEKIAAMKQESNATADEVKALKKLIVKMELEEKPIYKLIEQILTQMKDPVAGLTTAQIANIINSEWSSILNKTQTKTLCEAFDENKNGSVNAKEIKSFMLTWARLSKEKIISIDGLLMVLGKTLNADKIATEAYLKSIGINPSKTTVTVEELGTQIGNNFELEESQYVDLFEELDSAGVGAVDLKQFIAKVDAHRVRNDGSKVDSLKVDGSEAKSQASAEVQRQKDDWLLENLKSTLMAKGLSPIKIFESACKSGHAHAPIMMIKGALEKSLPDFPKTDLIKTIQVMDVDKNGFVSRDEFRMLFFDEKEQEEITENPIKKKPETSIGTDPTVGKFKAALESAGISPKDFFKEADTQLKSFINLIEMKTTIKNKLASSDLTVADIAKLMKKLDTNGNGSIEKAEFMEALTDPSEEQNNSFVDTPELKLKRDVSKPGTIPELKKSKVSRPSSIVLHKGTTVNDPEGQKQIEKAFTELIEQYTLEDVDYFVPGKKSILNNQMAALRYCHDIVKELERSGTKKWTDPEFGATPTDEHGIASIYFEEQLPGYPDPENIYWCRPTEISPDKTVEFLDDGANSNDVIQGELGDCWLIGGMSVLAVNDEYIRGNFNPTPEAILQISDQEAADMTKGVYCPIFHFLRKWGIFVMRFFKNYNWRYVVIDDSLPCYKYDECTPTLVFGRCKNAHEFWVPLMEKAYAKLHNTYEALIAGYLDDGLTDMTALVSEKTKMHGSKGFPGPGIESADALWKKISDHYNAGTMMGCSVSGGEGEVEHEVEIDGEPVGILKNHAYAIIDVLELPKPESTKPRKCSRLLRVRNPWGNKEWNGRWCDGSERLLKNIDKLNDHIKKEAKKEAEFEPFDPEADDGTFLMSFKDWRSIYNNLFSCIRFPQEWSAVRYRDQWADDCCGGTPLRKDPVAYEEWATNPQFIMDLKVNSRVFISLGQPDGRLIHGLKFPFKENIQPCCFTIMKMAAGQEKVTKFEPEKIVKLSILKEYREISMEIDLKAGRYAIVPSTQEKNQLGEFFLNIYYSCSKNEINLKKAGSDLKWEIIAEEEETVDQYDENIKMILKLKANNVIFSDDPGVMGTVWMNNPMKAAMMDNFAKKI